MMPDIAPGTIVNLEVTRTPRSERAAKTLSRLFAKDPRNQRADRLRKRLRTAHSEGRRRGGRIWMVRPSAPRLVRPGRGDACRIRATTDVLRDLGSVAKLVRITPAS